MLLPRLLALLASPLPAAGPPDPPAAPDPERGELVVFTLDDGGPVARAAADEVVPGFRALAEELGVAVRVLDASRGAPDEVALAPLFVYQNHRGRSIYQGRTTSPERFVNFLRTSRVAPQGDEPTVLEDAPVLRLGRVRIGAALKLTALSGDAPPGHDAGRFEAEARRGLAAGFERFAFEERVELGRSDRLFYLDLHPWRGADGELAVSIEAYSQFHCKEPVFSRLHEPVTGTWVDRADVFAAAARALEEAVLAEIAEPDGGDGFVPVPDAVPVASWEALELSLPPAPERAAADLGAADLPRAWRVAAPEPGDPPRVQFRFPAPLDWLRGEAGAVAGELVLAGPGRLHGASGHVEADAASVTLGEDELDQTVHGAGYLEVESHPTARFALEAFEAEADLAYGRLTQAVATGRFELRGRAVPLTVRVQLEPIVAADDRPRLVASGAFTLPLRDPWGLEGPGGPEPANSTLVFDVHLVLEPSAEGGE